MYHVPTTYIPKLPIYVQFIIRRYIWYMRCMRHALTLTSCNNIIIRKKCVKYRNLGAKTCFVQYPRTVSSSMSLNSKFSQKRINFFFHLIFIANTLIHASHHIVCTLAILYVCIVRCGTYFTNCCIEKKKMNEKKKLREREKKNRCDL